MNKQLNDIWEKKFGDDYTKRKLLAHEKEGKLRENFWKLLIGRFSDIKSVLEIGPNAGMNLEGIWKADPKLTITGIEPNEFAYNTATERSNGRYRIIKGSVYDLTPQINADLVITCTVLIHIHPLDLERALTKIYDSAGRYILIMEYYWPKLCQIEYRGLTDVLWKRDFGAYILSKFKLNIIETGYLDVRDGFDRTTWWLFEKNK